MPKLNSAQLRSLKFYAEDNTKADTYAWIDRNYSDPDKRKHAKQAARRWIRNADPDRQRNRTVDEDGPTGICELCGDTKHNTEIQVAQIERFDVYRHVCNDCVRDRRERDEYIILDYEFKQMVVSAGNPKKRDEHGKVNHVGAFSNTLRAYNDEDYPDKGKDTSDFDNHYDGKYA